MRLAGIEKMGYYPTPPQVAEQIFKILDIRPGCRVLDPCCGEGAVLKAFKRRYEGIITYGAELDANRFKIASAVTDNILNCDSTRELKVEPKTFDVLWENPPYDWDVVENDSQRVEKTFYKAHRGYISKEGILVFLIPFGVLESCINLLSVLRDVKVFAFPPQEYKVFRQIVVIGRQYGCTTQDDDNYKMNSKYLKSIVREVPADRAYEYLETTEHAAERGEILYTVEPTGNGAQALFKSKRIVPEEVYQLVRQSKLNEIMRELQSIDEINTISPISPLTDGHLAMLLAAGMMDGAFVGDDGDRYVVKGSVKCGVQETECFSEDGSSRITQRTTYSIVVKSINLTRGTMEIISA
jgi:16S rRNA G966 N2-methylase RsmD